MKKFLNILKEVAKYIWQLPQNLLGLLLIAIYQPNRKHVLDNGVEIHYSVDMNGGISLGKYAIVHSLHYRQKLEDSLKRDTVRHEAIGHTKQSLILGPLYLPIVGLQSICWAGLYGSVIKPTTNGYYKFWTEKWADKIAGVER
jgi:hypothetical protein